MSLNGVNHLPIEYISLDATVPLALLILGLFQFCLYIILDWDNKVYSFFLGSNNSPSSPIKSQDEFHSNSKNLQSERKKNEFQLSNKKQNEEEESICREELEIVMKKMGIFCCPESSKLQERFNCGDISNLFEEKEPTLDEVKSAFDVFDENKDGFIDAKELQRLLCSLGLNEGIELKNCRKMIRAFDENGDDRIDFHEFLKFMESSLC
ncbi:hypothetical protein M9H77_15509 [Catharanthus roseus]|uniref:Uncharacterized protein n=1 Tax=Catharanthus roseus TaxID=4058 RepID=A0ACC0B0W2_CATRO|nr:hypothetical protein M9H77_15509 [Catharanthus roseus]